MTHDEFEHVVSAAAHITDDEIVDVGSQAIHGQFRSPPAGLLVSRNEPVRGARHEESVRDGARRLRRASVWSMTIL